MSIGKVILATLVVGVFLSVGLVAGITTGGLAGGEEDSVSAQARITARLEDLSRAVDDLSARVKGLEKGPDPGEVDVSTYRSPFIGQSSRPEAAIDSPETSDASSRSHGTTDSRSETTPTVRKAPTRPDGASRGNPSTSFAARYAKASAIPPLPKNKQGSGSSPARPTSSRR